MEMQRTEQVTAPEAAAESSRILAAVMDLGETMLAAGGEAGRVEDTISRVGLAYGFRKVDVFTITSCIFATIEDEAGNILTQTRRVRGISMDMEKVRMCNDLSRRLCEDPPRGEALRREIEGLSETKTYGKLITYLSYSLIAGMMAIFFGGDGDIFRRGFPGYGGCGSGCSGGEVCISDRKKRPSPESGGVFCGRLLRRPYDLSAGTARPGAQL